MRVPALAQEFTRAGGKFTHGRRVGAPSRRRPFLQHVVKGLCHFRKFIDDSSVNDLRPLKLMQLRLVREKDLALHNGRSVLRESEPPWKEHMFE